MANTRESSDNKVETAVGAMMTQPQGKTRDNSCRSQADLDVVAGWDGPGDPANPRNWSRSKKNLHIAIVSIFTLYANLAATMFAPGAKELVDEFRVANSALAAFTVSIYVLGFAVGPLVLAPLSELYGRLVIYHLCGAVYFAFTLGCVFSTNVAMFLVFRFVCGCAGSGPMSIGGGTVADLTPREKRGAAMALFAVGPLLGPVIGPVIGGFVSQSIGWRWTFRIILIISGVMVTVTAIFMRETFGPIIIQNRAKKLRKATENESVVRKRYRNESPGEMLLHAIVRPAKMLLLSPIVLLISLYSGTTFGLMFLLFTTFPAVFEGVYGFTPGIAGLTYLGLGIGMLSGLMLFVLLSDKLLGQKGEAAVARPEERLILMKWFAPIIPLGCFLYGWSAQYHIHWIVPILGTLMIGLGTLFIMLPAQIYLVDAFGSEAAASALAANLVVRSPFGAFLTFAATPLYNRLGLGWGNSVLGFICVAFAPIPWLFYRYGEDLRTRFAIKL